MQKQNIYQPGANEPYGKPMDGWRTLNNSQRGGWLLLVSCGVALISLMSWEVNKILIPSGIVMVLSLGLWWLRDRAPQPAQSTSLLAALQLRDGKVWIGQQALPDNLRKLVLGKASARGPAFLQLPWNQGDQWQFNASELPQVRQFLKQHLPHVQIIED
jgi:hypothetical protein